MRHSFSFDGLATLDIGRAVPVIQIDHDKLSTPHALQGSVVDFLVINHPRLRSAVLDLIISQHVLLFPYEDGDEAREKLEILLGEQGAVDPSGDQADPAPWQFGDALRLELVVKAPTLRIVDHDPSALTEYAITEMMRNAYRRLHVLERPVTEWFFNVFMQASQPTQIPLDVLYASAIDKQRPPTADAAAIMRENATFWKAQLQSIGNQYLTATCHDPRLMTLQNAALYQQLKNFFGEDGES
ncbi:hypothetical protein [Desulfopila aestuarii]|uniref:Nucleotidyl transferase AbiEii toxin, Type IV TA system n=1 Tax=Desulfopila aestuarii DSM 18488 TaxID=1121416 RepID=A0A1M7YK22_9BACT|nr:hypothetical protein [Desulfopila aestuarii]SHO52970.1 hypothetical protein SAMN02745220_04861 [Desulfopila aestuarii DSM 18488]